MSKIMSNRTEQGKYLTLEELNREEVIRQLPLLVFLSALVISGVIGNTLVLYVYKTKYGPSSCRTFVLFLSIVDLISASVGIPLEILVLLREFNFRFSSVCKISVLLNSWPTLTSGFVLLAIAVDRHRKICHPFLWQITPRTANYICIIGVLLALAFSWMSPLIYGVKSSEHPIYNINVSECAVTESMEATVFPLINSVCFAVLFVGALISMAIMYIFIGIEMRAFSERRAALKSDYLSLKLKRQDNIPRHDHQSENFLTVLPTNQMMPDHSDAGSDVIFCGESSDKQHDKMADTSMNTSTRDMLTIADVGDNATPKSDTPMSHSSNRLARKSWLSKTLRSIRANRRDYFLTNSLSTPSSENSVFLRSKDQKADSSRRKAQRTATIMLRVTVAFVVSYLPFLCLLFIRTCVSGFTESLNETERAVYKFFLRSYYLNCAINPVIYGMWDARFRQTVTQFCFRFRRKEDI